MTRRLVHNTREQLLSNDHNRAQSFSAAGRENLLRALYNDLRQGFYSFPGWAVPRTALEAPLAADVYSGLMVRVDNATSLLIDPGVMTAWIGTTDPDGSSLALVVDPGVQTLGQLTFTANGGGFPRLDVIECSVSQVVTEQSNRNIFDPGSGIFVPALVDKVVEARLTYRIRLGTPGGGYPGNAAGWLPLAVACVQPGAANFSQVDFWDVRPLVEERIGIGTQPSGTLQFASHRACEYSLIDTGSQGLEGYSDAVFGGYAAGGDFRKSSASSLAQFNGVAAPNGGEAARFYWNAAENHAAGFAMPVAGYVYLAAVFPAGLPRWVRYSQAAISPHASRLPRGPRGILVVTNTAPLADGYFAAVNLPTSSGFTSAAPGVLLAIGVTASSAVAQGIGSDGWHYMGALSGVLAFTPIVTTASSAAWDLPAAWFPQAVSELKVRISGNLEVAASGRQSIQVALEPSGGGTVMAFLASDVQFAAIPSPGINPFHIDVRIPLPRTGRFATNRFGFRVSILFGGLPAPTALTSVLMHAHAFRL